MHHFRLLLPPSPVWGTIAPGSYHAMVTAWGDLLIRERTTHMTTRRAKFKSGDPVTWLLPKAKGASLDGLIVKTERKHVVLDVGYAWACRVLIPHKEVIVRVPIHEVVHQE